jgi:hypothetical protein
MRRNDAATDGTHEAIADFGLQRCEMGSELPKFSKPSLLLSLSVSLPHADALPPFRPSQRMVSREATAVKRRRRADGPTLTSPPPPPTTTCAGCTTTRQGLGGTYLPKPILVEARDGERRSPFCYISRDMEPHPPTNDYIDRIVGPARLHGFPDWYTARLAKASVRRSDQRVQVVAGGYMSRMPETGRIRFSGEVLAVKARIRLMLQG